MENCCCSLGLIMGNRTNQLDRHDRMETYLGDTRPDTTIKLPSRVRWPKPVYWLKHPQQPRCFHDDPGIHQHMEVSMARGATPIAGWLKMENPIDRNGWWFRSTPMTMESPTSDSIIRPWKIFGSQKPHMMPLPSWRSNHISPHVCFFFGFLDHRFHDHWITSPCLNS